MGAFNCLYLGAIPNVSIMTTVDDPTSVESPQSFSNFRRSDTSSNPSNARSPDIQLIDRVDNAQLEGRIPYEGSSDNHSVAITISKHGLKIAESDSRGGNVIERIPLHMVAQAVVYDDGFSRWNVAIKTGQVGKNQFTCHVFQTENENEAEAICQSIRDVFARVVK